MIAHKNTCNIIEFEFPEISQYRFESLIDFLGELLVAERLQELDQIDQYRICNSIENQPLTGGRN